VIIAVAEHRLRLFGAQPLLGMATFVVAHLSVRPVIISAPQSTVAA
jgi:hypothetical protein